MVETYLAKPNDGAWIEFRDSYLALLDQRFGEERKPFDELAALAMKEAVYLGCSCPTKQNPVVGRCHTYLAIEFMRRRYPELEVIIPR